LDCLRTSMTNDKPAARKENLRASNGFIFPRFVV
jgi:hypothetical protein